MFTRPGIVERSDQGRCWSAIWSDSTAICVAKKMATHWHIWHQHSSYWVIERWTHSTFGKASPRRRGWESILPAEGRFVLPCQLVWGPHGAIGHQHFAASNAWGDPTKNYGFNQWFGWRDFFFLQFSLKLISPNQETRNVVNTTPLLMTLCLIGMTIVIILGLTGIVTDPIEAKRVEHNIKSVSWHRPRPAKTLNMVLSCPSRVV